jgi:Protein of unknown function (DUF2845)
MEPVMRRFSTALAAMAATFLCLSARAESLRCSGGIAAEGDSRVSVLYKCGQPLLADSYCAPVYYSQSLRPVPESIAGAFVPCPHIDEWVYERGAGNLVATVRFRAGKVLSITYGRVPQ